MVGSGQRARQGGPRRRCGRCGAAQDRSWDRCPYCPEPFVGMPEAAWLVPLAGAAAGELWILDRVERLGTDQDCSRTIDDPYASGMHAELSHSAGRWLLRDLGSTNGTYVNGQRARGAELRDGDRLQIGQLPLAFRSLGPSRDPEQAVDAGPSLTGWLVPLAGARAGEALVVAPPGCRLGTAAGAQHTFADDFMSGFHAEVIAGGGAFYLQDLGSTNGTHRNGRPVTRERLLDGDRIRLGRTELVFKSA